MESGGEKLMRSVQDWFAGRVADAEKVDNSGQEPPETTKPEVMLGLVPLPGTAKVSGVLPALTMVTVCGLSVLVEPALVVAKRKAGGSTRSSFQMVDVEWPMKKRCHYRPVPRHQYHSSRTRSHFGCTNYQRACPCMGHRYRPAHRRCFRWHRRPRQCCLRETCPGCSLRWTAGYTACHCPDRQLHCRRPRCHSQRWATRKSCSAHKCRRSVSP